MQEQSVQTRHGRVAALDYGGLGPDLVLLHGAGATLAHWGLVRPHLEAARVVALDFRWHGRSSDEGDVGVEANADDVEAVIEELGLDNPVVAGHSLGGVVAAVYGSRHAEAAGVANLDGHGWAMPKTYTGVDAASVDNFRRQYEGLMKVMVASGSGDKVWRDKHVATQSAGMASAGWSAEFVDELTARAVVEDDRGQWKTRPAPAYFDLIGPAIAAAGAATVPTMTDGTLPLLGLYETVACQFLIYNCVRRPQMPIPDAEALVAAYRSGLDADLRSLAATRSNITVKTVDATHMVLFDHPEEVAADLLALGAAPRG